MKFPFTKFSIFVFICWCLPATAKIILHTDNAHDLASFKQSDMRSLSSETNILALTQQTHKLHFEFVPLKRSLKFMAQGQSICITNKIKTHQRAQQFIFSKPINLFLGRRLYQFSDLSSQGINEPISLAELFVQYPQRRLIVSDQISYGDKLDQQITKLPEQNKIVRRGASHVQGILDMFSERRGEYALFYPLEMSARQWQESTVSYTVAGIEPYLLGRLMCVNNPETRQFIKKVNKQIDTLNQDGALLRAHLKYYHSDFHQDVTRFVTAEFLAPH